MHARKIIQASLLSAPLILALPQAICAETVYEIEPNNTPVEATEIRGASTLIGTLQGNDQDGYKWLVSDVDAGKRWTLELRGIPGRLTVVDVLRVEYTENGVDVAGVEKLFTIGSRDGTRPGLAENLLFEPGEYILGVAHSGDSGTFRPPVDSISFGEERGEQTGEKEAGAYRLYIREGEYYAVKPEPVENDTQEKAYQVGPGATFASFAVSTDSWFRIPVNENSAGNYWDFTGQVPVGRQGNVFLRDAQGAQLAQADVDRLGKFDFRDLGLAAGEYYVEFRGKAGNAIRFFGSIPVGQVAEGREAEPNDNWQQANRIRISVVEGRLAAPTDADYFSLQVDEELAGMVTGLRLTATGESRVDLCLHDSKRNSVQCRQGVGEIEIPDLVLTETEWGLSVRGGQDNEYTLTYSGQGPIEPGVETEPNDSIDYATSLPLKNRIKGRFRGRDTDYFRIVVAESPQLWRFQAMGEGIGGLQFYDASGIQNQHVAAAPGQRRVRLDNVFLLPGTHYISVFGQDGGEYTLLARPLGPPDPNGEIEPNDDASRMQPLAVGQTRTGLLPDADQDNYRFHLANWDHIRLTVTPPPDASLLARIYWDGTELGSNNPGLGQPLVLEGLFQPGDFRVELWARTPSEAEYTIRLERLPRFGCPVDCEPNNNPAFAKPLPVSRVIEGQVGDWGDWDWYELPVFERETELRITPVEQTHIEVLSGTNGANQVSWNEAERAYIGTIPPAQTNYLVVRRSWHPTYRLSIDYDNQPGQADTAVTAAATIQLHLETETVSGYRLLGQQINGSVTLANTGTEPLELALLTASSDRRWRVQIESEMVRLAPGISREVPLTVLVPDDAWANRSVRVSVAARTKDGRLVEAFRDVTVDGDLGAVNPRRHWDLPDSLLGGFNVAANHLGGRLELGPDSGVNWPEKANDGIAVDADIVGFQGGGDGLPAELVLELAGGEPVKIAGVTMNLLSGTASRYLRKLDLESSLDGIGFEKVLVQELDPVKQEQAFVFGKPVEGRYVKLVSHDDFTGRTGSGATFGELKVISAPGFDLSGGKGFNLAAPELGGHVVWANPQFSQNRERESLTEETEGLYVGLKPAQSLEWVIGFNHDRAAKLSRLEWVHPAEESRYKRFSTVRVSRSMDSPVGPWQPLGEWELGESGESPAYEFEDPEWARFLRFSTDAAKSAGTYSPPETLRVWEVPTAGDYMSILAEWGFASQAAIYEYLQELQTEPPPRISENLTRDRAAELRPEQHVAGVVQLGEQVNWYQYAVPSDHNTLVIALGGESTVRTSVRVEDESAEQIPARIRASDGSPSMQIIKAIVEPGGVVYLEVSEPPRNVAFLWDTSPSVGAFIPIIYNAMISYAGDLVPGRDAANFAPYGSSVLLRDWYGEPYILQTVLNEYPRQESSSQAEYTMELASRALAKRPGTKAIINVTDAATLRYASAWDQFAEVKPRMFNLGVSSAGNLGPDPRAEQDLMQDWSRVNGGHYQYMLSQGEMEVAFDRAATLMRRPADYTLKVTSEFREAPGPGTLRVVATDGGTAGAASGGVELILDASGSMLKRLNGKRRIAIAREVLSDAVRNTIPAGTPVALRVFGHKEPNACRTDLEIPLGPLDPDATVKAIESINAMNLAKTPIAASLAAAEQDLGSSEGPNVIVLLTDGEETCEGDPEKTIQGLKDKGLDVSVNIVGFAIDDVELERQFERWSQAGNGRYFSAQDQSGLSEAITEALQTPYLVYDQSGEQVASGIVGGQAVALEAGFYRVVVATSPQQVFDDVEVPGESNAELELKP